MLTPENIAALRRAAYRSQSRRADGTWAVVQFEGGPLDGILGLPVPPPNNVGCRLRIAPCRRDGNFDGVTGRVCQCRLTATTRVSN